MECSKLMFLRVPCSGLPPKLPSSLVILALLALLRQVSPHALALSIGGVLGGGALRRSFNPVDAVPGCPSDWGYGILFGFISTPGASLGACSGTFWRSPCALSIGGTLLTGAPSQRSRSVPRLVVLHVPALLLALLTGPMIFLLSGK